MARTDINGNAISCHKCKKGHRDASCNDSHPGPCFYRGKRGRPRKGEFGQVSGPIQVPDCLLRPSSGVPRGSSPLVRPLPTPPPEVMGGPQFEGNGNAAFAASPEASPWASSPNGQGVFGQFAMAPPFQPLPTPPYQAVGHPHFGVNGSAASAAPPHFPPYAPSPMIPDFSGLIAAGPMLPAQIGGNGYNSHVAPSPLPSDATSPSAFHPSGQPAALALATSSEVFSSGEALATPAIPVGGGFLASMSRELASETRLGEAGLLEEAAVAEEQGLQSSEMTPAVSPVPHLPDLPAESDATPQPTPFDMASGDWSLLDFDEQWWNDNFGAEWGEI